MVRDENYVEVEKNSRRRDIRPSSDRGRSVVARSTLFAALVAILTCTSSADVAAEAPLSAAGDGHETVPVYVDGKGPFPFILDSGADSSAVYDWFARRQHLKPASGGGEQLSGQTGSTKVTMYQIQDIRLDGRHLRHLQAFGLPDRRDAGREAGVLGNDFMDGAIVAFDFPCHRIEVYAKPANIDRVAGQGAPPVLAGVDKGTTLLTLPVTVNGASGIAVLDTGSRNTRLTTSFAKAAGIDAASPRFGDAEAIYGANSKGMTPRYGPIGAVGFGGLLHTGVKAQVIDLPMLKEDFGGKPAMLLGADLLGRYRLIYDHRARKIWLRPSRCSI